MNASSPWGDLVFLACRAVTRDTLGPPFGHSPFILPLVSQLADATLSRLKNPQERYEASDGLWRLRWLRREHSGTLTLSPCPGDLTETQQRRERPLPGSTSHPMLDAAVPGADLACSAVALSPAGTWPQPAGAAPSASSPVVNLLTEPCRARRPVELSELGPGP